MKSPKHIVFKLLFLVTVLFCLVLNDYTYNTTPVNNTELSSDLNYKDNNIFSFSDSSEDDYINQTHAHSNFVNQLIIIPISKDSHLFKEFTFPSWKPPKYS